jgi:Ca-activated chloride channel family protein
MRAAFLCLVFFGVAVGGEAGAIPLTQTQEALCPKCKAQLKPGAKFCTSCGEKVPVRECSQCKKPLAPGAKFCTNCGQKVEEAGLPPSGEKRSSPPPAVEPKKDPIPATPDVAKPAERKEGPTPAPAGPVGKETDPDSVKAKWDEELRRYGTSADEVNRAIDRGSAYLAGVYSKRDLAGEDDYLAAYALMNTLPYRTNARLREKIHRFLREGTWLKSGQAVYCAGLRAMCLEASGDPDLRRLARACAEYLVETQGPKGTWTYKNEVALTLAPVPPEVKESAITVSGGEPLEGAPKGEDLVRKGVCKNPEDGDTSCTQFAVLGLHAAARCGFRVPREVWERCLKAVESRQNPDGGWAYYDPGSVSYGSMTCAGICTEALCRFYLGDRSYLGAPSIQSGLAWMAKNFSPSANPQSPRWLLYYLYSVERLGVFAATESFGEHRWYPMGAKHLVGAQKPEGYWETTEEEKLRGTSLALLFLTRATTPVQVLKRGGSGWLETHLVTDRINIMFILDASGSMRDEMDGKEKFQIVKDVVESIARKLPEESLVGLRVYGHRKSALDDNADLDSELVIPVGPLNVETFVDRVRSLKCKGMTPLTYSLTEAMKDVSGVSGDAEIITVLLTDGGETTRGAKPPEAAAKLAASRKGMKVHVVGFDIYDDDWREQLEKTASAGKGTYFHARKARDLLNALSLATSGTSDYILRDASGKEFLKGKIGDRQRLTEGRYVLSMDIGGQKAEETVWINTEVTSHATVNLGGLLKRN